MFFSNSFYICPHGAAINFLILTSPLSFFARRFHLSTQSLSFLTLVFSVMHCFTLFLTLFWMLWMLVTVFHSCHVPHASRITTWGTLFTERLFSLSKEWVRSWLHSSLTICEKTFATRLKEVRPKSYGEGETEKEKEQELGDDLKVCMMNILPKVSSLPKFISYKPNKNGDIDLSNSSVTTCWSFDQRVMIKSL